MSEEQQSASFDSDLFSSAETLELLQGSAERFQELVNKLKTEPIDYKLPKSSYVTLLTTSENIFNAVAAASGSQTGEKTDFARDFSGNELTKIETLETLQGQVDYLQKTIDKITGESLDYQLSMSSFENLVAITEKIANSIKKAPSLKTETIAEPPSSTREFTEYAENSSNIINWPWLGLVAVILILVISISIITKPESVNQEIALDVSPPQLEFTGEQKAIVAIDKQIEKIAIDYEMDSLAKIEPNFVTDRLTLEIAENWQELNENKREEIANKWLQDSRKLSFKKLEIIDKEGALIARSPLIGKNIVILQK